MPIAKTTPLEQRSAPTRSELLPFADSLIHGDRENEYGSKLTNFTQIAMLFQGTIGHKLQPNARITPEDVALLMIQVKVARLAKSPDHTDSVVDIAGYAGCYDELQLQRQSGMGLPGAMVDPRQV